MKRGRFFISLVGLFIIFMFGTYFSKYDSNKEMESPTSIHSNESPQILEQDQENLVKRLSGTNRYQTAIEISKEGFPKANTVVIARGDDFPDALAGTPLAYQLDAPILLTRTHSLGIDVQDEIKRLGAKKGVILGGSAAVSLEVEKQLKDLGLTIERVSGKSRFQTAEKIAQKLTSNKEAAVVVYGYNFPDALAIAPYAARNGYPILLTNIEKIPNSTENIVDQYNQTFIIGGEYAISREVEWRVPSPTRISGKDRFQTVDRIMTKFGKEDSEFGFIATGNEFADALTGSVLAAKRKGPLILTIPHVLPKPFESTIENKRFKNVTLLGGQNAIRISVEKDIKEKVASALKPREFSYATSFSEGLAAVAEGYSLDDEWGVINKQGEFVIPLEYDNMSEYQGERAIASMYGGHYLLDTKGNKLYSSKRIQRINNEYYFTNDKRGVINRDGKAVFTLGNEEKMYDFSENWMSKYYDARNDKYGYVHITGAPKVAAQFDEGRNFLEERAAVRLRDTWGFIDKSGETVIPIRYQQVRDFSEGYAFVKEGDKWGLMDKQGNWVIEPSYDDINSDFSEGLAAVKNDTNVFYINKQGEVVLDPDIDYGLEFNDGLARVTAAGSYGVIDKTGSFVIPAEFAKIEEREDGNYLVSKNNKYGICCKFGLYNREGDMVIEPINKSISHPSEERILFETTDSTTGYMDLEGNIVIPASYEGGTDFSEGLASVKKYGKYGYIDVHGNLVIDFLYNEALPFKEGFAVVRIGNRRFFIDKNGKQL
ncbi:WG repeat-containing protein [Bacillus timonensis]|uniref:WG repeat-containing protein n=1 Tax=Bacillus timonensis TaxID=1033734 RepID=UPI000288D1BF|nr:WG repeat-containing protein [Bacillus timonensis]